MNQTGQAETVQLTADIVAFVANNRIAQTDLSELIQAVHLALTKAPAAAAEPAKPDLVPAVPIKKLVTPDYFISLEDGKKFKSLRRHLRTSHSMTPDDYRRKWGLPRDYPMVAPNYAKTRSELAKSSGLGRKAAPAPARKAVTGRNRKAKARA